MVFTIMFFLKSFGEEVSGSLTVFQDFYRANQIAGIGDYAEVVHGKYCGSLTIVSYQDYKSLS